jgi:hypothetical protein
MGKKLRTAGITVLAAAVAGALAALIIRDQIVRHRRDLFSPKTLERLAALGHMARLPASVDNIRLLQDFLAWEPRKLLRKRARSIVERMEAEALQPGLQPGAGTA